MTDISTRALVRADLPAVRSVLDAAELFPADMLADMAEPFLSGQAPHRWLVACSGERIVGFAYAEPERMTDGTFNLLAMAVHPDVQRRGIGAALVAGLEDRLRADGGRVLLVETSALDGYSAARAFYARCAFIQEATIRHFYTEGEDKVVFWKHL